MAKNMGPTLRMEISGGPYLLPSKADIEPIEEQPFDFSRKYNEVLEEPDSKDRSSEPATYQDDDMPRVYCTEGTPLISRASSVGDLTGNDKRRPETIYEQEEITLASHTATANATPRIWSGNGSPTSMNSFCMNGNSQFDAHSIVSEFSRQPSGLISPSDLPDSPGQTMPPSPKERRPVYAAKAEHPFDYAYPQHLQSSSHIPPAARFTPIALDEVKHDVKPPNLNLVRPNPEPRQMRPYADSKTLIGDQYTQEDSLHNYRTEDTPANLSAATSYSDLSSICPKSDCHGPIPKPRSRKSVTPSTGRSPLPPLATSHVSDLYTPVEEAPINLSQHRENSLGIMDDQKSETSSSMWKPRTLPRKLRDSLQSKDIGASSSCSHNKSMPDLNKKSGDSLTDSEDDEVLMESINKGRPGKKGDISGVSSKLTQKKNRKQSNKGFDSGSESDQQQILDELIKLGRPQSRNQTLKLKSKPDRRDEDYGPSSSSSSKDKFKAARSMESLSVTAKVVKKGATNFCVREQPIRGGEAVIPKSAVTRAQSLKGNKTLGYDPVHDRRQTKTPDPTEAAKFDMPFLTNRSNKPVSKVSPMRSSPKKYADEDDEPCHKSVLLSPLRSSVRQSRQVCVKKTVELTADSSDAEEPQPPRPPKPPQFRAPPKPPSGSPEPVVTPEPAVVSMPDVVQRTLPDIVAEETAIEEENNNNNNNSVAEGKIDFPPEPPEDSGDITVLSFKFTDSNRNYTRRFLATNQFHSVLNYLACKGFPSDKYKIVVPSLLRIKKEVTESSYGKTLAELKMVPKKTLTVKPR